MKKAKVFTKEELFRFLRFPGSGDRYLLVRKVVAVIAYCGGNRLGEVKSLTMDSVKLCERGYTVTFVHLKQRSHLESSQ